MNPGEQAELLDTFDAVGNPLDVATRAEVHERGLWHQVFHCQIVALRAGAHRAAAPTMVLQRRSRQKAAFGGLVDVSAAGHLHAGEQPADGVRELAEELGVEVEADQLVELGVRRLADDSGEGRANKEHTHVFLLRDDRPLDAYVVATDEVDALLDVPTEGLLALLAGEVPAIEVNGMIRPGAPDAAAITEQLSLDDLVPDFGYWTTLAVMAERFGLGKRPLAV